MPRARARQIALPLPRRPGRPRRKPGAGGPVPHRVRPEQSRRHPVHVTLSLARDLPSLRNGRLYRALRPCFVAGKERFGARVLQFAVQRNHLHLLLEAADRVALSRAIKGLGVRIARRLNRRLGRKAPVLAERYHARALRTPSEVRRCLVYVLCNARKHERPWGWRGAHDAARGKVPGVALTSGRAYAVVATGELGLGDVLEGRFDPFSSAAWFDGWRGGGPDGGPPESLECPVARPRTWLAAAGWRRRGLLDPTEAPADRGSGAERAGPGRSGLTRLTRLARLTRLT